jgi:crossover junction endodeoxyribonuclease RuvC
MRILGVDPGLGISGYGCVEGPGEQPALIEAGVIRIARTGDLASRLAELDADFRDVLERLRPDVVAVESLFAHYKHPSTAIIMGHARGVLLLGARRAGARLIEYRPNLVKKALTGHGHAPKDQMQRAIQGVFRLPSLPEPPDLADALAIALCASRRIPFEDAVATDPKTRGIS